MRTKKETTKNEFIRQYEHLENEYQWIFKIINRKANLRCLF